MATPATLAIAPHLARFELSDRGTKVLMVEWHPALAPAPDLDAAPASAPAPAPPVPSVNPASERAAWQVSWQVSWPGKSSTNLISAHEADVDDAGPRRRIYFLLPHAASIPLAVSIAGSGGAIFCVKPLPAIFPPGLNADAGTRGVLHTLWAKARLSELQNEIDAELETNAESVGLDMALGEKQWILDDFLRVPPTPVNRLSPPAAHTRIVERSRRLRLATSPAELAGTSSTEASAVSRLPFALALGQRSCDSVSSAQDTSSCGQDCSLITAKTSMQDEEDDLFALPLSPRSPDMKSPFSVL